MTQTVFHIVNIVLWLVVAALAVRNARLCDAQRDLIESLNELNAAKDRLVCAKDRLLAAKDQVIHRLQADLRASVIRRMQK